MKYEEKEDLPFEVLEAIGYHGHLSLESHGTGYTELCWWYDGTASGRCWPRQEEKEKKTGTPYEAETTSYGS